MSKLTEYIKSSIEELKKVKWLTKKEAVNHTVLVIVICLVMGLFLGAVDFGLSKVLYLVLK